jgi:hypothetical protein
LRPGRTQCRRALAPETTSDNRGDAARVGVHRRAWSVRRPRWRGPSTRSVGVPVVQGGSTHPRRHSGSAPDAEEPERHIGDARAHRVVGIPARCSASLRDWVADRGARMTEAPIGHCHDCDRTWSALGEAHCATCCAHFTSDSAFDLHLARADSDEPCHDPATVTRRDGRPVVTFTERASGTAWMRYSEGGHHFSKAARAVTERLGAANPPASDLDAAAAARGALSAGPTGPPPPLGERR